MMRSRRGGAILLYVLVILALVGGAAMILAATCGEMAFESREAYVEACGRDLVASGLAWAEHHAATQEGPLATEKTLDVAELAAPRGAVAVTIRRVAGRKAEAVVHATCRRGRRLLDRRDTCELPDSP